MVRSGRPDSAAGQQSLGDLVAGAAKDVLQLLRYEISLAKSELKMDVRRIGIAARSPSSVSSWAACSSCCCACVRVRAGRDRGLALGRVPVRGATASCSSPWPA